MTVTDLEALVERLERAVEAAPDAPSIHYRRGLALSASGEREAALQAFHVALSLGPFPESAATREEIARLLSQSTLERSRSPHCWGGRDIPDQAVLLTDQFETTKIALAVTIGA